MSRADELRFRTEEEQPEPLLARSRLQRGLRALKRRGGAGQSLEFFPIVRLLRGYRARDLKGDARAGVNVALLDFPQGMAYAVIAGLPFTMGIYASAVAAMVGPLLASSRFIMLGPTNAIAVLTLSSFIGLGFTQEQAVAAMPLLLLMVAAIMLLGGFFGAAGMIRFVSRTVVTGYITAAALLIVVKQMRHVLGVTTEKTATVVDTVISLARHLPETHLPTLGLAAVTMVLYLVFKRVAKGLPHIALVLIVMTLVAEWLRGQGWVIAPLSATPLAAGYWPVTVPTFSFELVSQLAAPAMAIAFLSLLESSSIAKTLAARAGDPLNVNQQMVSMGTANAAGAFLGGMPISGSLTRSALNFASGARTPVASMLSAALLAVGILFLAPYMAVIPMPALSALVVLVGLSLLNRKNLRIALGATSSDAVVFGVTFTSGLLFPLDTAIFFGIGASLFLFLRQAAAPRLSRFDLTEPAKPAPEDPAARSKEPGHEPAEAEPPRPALALLHLDGNFFFGSSDVFLDEMRRLLADPSVRFVLVRLRNALYIDASAAQAISDIARLMHEQDRHLFLVSVRPEAEKTLRNSGVLQDVGCDNVFREDPDNPNLSTSLALRRAQQLADGQLELRLFVHG